MSTEAAAKKKWTPEEYLAFERSVPEKHELRDGEVRAMSPPSAEHQLIITNLICALRSALRDGPGEVYLGMMRLKVPASSLYTYADMTVVSDRPEFEGERTDTLLNPAIIVEVLAEATEAYDRGEKFEQYRKLPSLREYVLVSQEHVLVEKFTRREDGSWDLSEHRAGGQVWLEAIASSILVDEIYEGVFEDLAGGPGPGLAAE